MLGSSAGCGDIIQQSFIIQAAEAYLHSHRLAKAQYNLPWVRELLRKAPKLQGNMSVQGRE